jgi:nucleotide-binding universal stress UspA family protein
MCQRPRPAVADAREHVIEHLLVPLDGSETAESALPHAEAIARLLSARITLARVPETTVVPVMSGAIWVTEEVEVEAAAQEAERYLDQVRRRPGLADLDVDVRVPDPPVAAGLLDAIAASGAGLVVMTTHGFSGFKRWVFGSVADKVLHASHVPVYLIREVDTPDGPPTFARLLVPLDGSPLAEAALAPAAEFARRARATLILVQVPTVPSYVTGIPETAGWIPHFLRDQANEASIYLQEQATRLVEQGITSDIDVEVVTAGSVADGILSSAREHDAGLIVMSTHGRTGLGRWMLGSVADQVLRGSDRPVWVTRVQGTD